MTTQSGTLLTERTKDPEWACSQSKPAPSTTKVAIYLRASAPLRQKQ